MLQEFTEKNLRRRGTSHPQATQSHTKANCKPTESHSKATPKPHQSHTKATPRPGELEGAGGTEPLSRGRAGDVFRVFPRLLATFRLPFLSRFGPLARYQQGSAKVGSLRIMIGSLSFTG
jgi:hypothetical protein